MNKFWQELFLYQLLLQQIQYVITRYICGYVDFYLFFEFIHNYTSDLTINFINYSLSSSHNIWKIKMGSLFYSNNAILYESMQ